MPLNIAVLVLVSGTILMQSYRFSKLPPGFSHELRFHLEHDATIDPVTGVPMMDFENYCCGMEDTGSVDVHWTDHIST